VGIDVSSIHEPAALQHTSNLFTDLVSRAYEAPKQGTALQAVMIDASNSSYQQLHAQEDQQ
jgi:hypothetical protein